MKKTKIVFGISFLFSLLLLLSSTFIINEDEIAVIKTLGRVTSIIVNPSDKELVVSNLEQSDRSDTVQVITEKGLHFKIPFYKVLVNIQVKT